jgi:hypothetical protein
MDPEDALRLTVWPPAGLEAPPAQARWPKELVEEARALYADGWSIPVVAERLIVPESTAKTWIELGGYRRDRSRRAP